MSKIISKRSQTCRQRYIDHPELREQCRLRMLGTTQSKGTCKKKSISITQSYINDTTLKEQRKKSTDKYFEDPKNRKNQADYKKNWWDEHPTQKPRMGEILKNWHLDNYTVERGRQLSLRQKLYHVTHPEYHKKVVEQLLTVPSKKGKSGRRKDLKNKFFRSKLEANFARFLKFMSIPYEFESEKCWFTLSDGHTYICDFYLPTWSHYIQTKGYLWEEDKKKLELFTKDYPNIKHTVFMQDSFCWKHIERQYKNIIPCWEK